MEHLSSPSPLAYVFWHTSEEGCDPETYEARLIDFHGSLAAARPEGFLQSAVFRHYALPWAPPSMFVYEDWYLVTSFTALGALNEAAVFDVHRDVHDRAADEARWGAGGLYRSRAAGARLHPGFTYWLSKPEDMGYEAFYDVLGVRAVELLWQRQMVLGPAPEFCILSEERLEVDLPDTYESSAHAIVRPSV